MSEQITTIANYLTALTPERREAMEQLRQTILQALPKGFAECMSYGMIGYVVPHTIYPKGYHCNTKLPLPFINIGSKKNGLVMHHLGLYGMPSLCNWFVAEYAKQPNTKLDMGKGCVRFKNSKAIPFALIAELAGKITVAAYIAHVESTYSK